MTAVPDILLQTDFWPAHRDLFAELMDVVTWDDRMQARRTASFGRPYDYSQMSYAAKALPTCLMPVQQALQKRLQVPFNNCLLNLYETGVNTMGFHADETSGLFPETGVAVLSLGGTRNITFRSIDQTMRTEYVLPGGSLLSMDHTIQKLWMHAIRRQTKQSARISLTWRAVL